ncbi:GNAT family N-acetyltransferase [Azospirillum sp.]|uniref:GNAT family N-acetyltransferase n=1 Tax=Azospirillum sp. TaxID=34012 RepID=UPI003D74E47B
MGDAFTVRPLVMADAPARLHEQVVEVIQAAHRRSDGTLPERFLSPALFDQVYDGVYSVIRDRARFLVALADGAVIGVGGYRPAWCSGHGWELAYGAVLPAWQGIGVGMALLRARLDAIAQAGSTGDFIIARSGRPSTFIRLGFRQVSVSDPLLLVGTVGMSMPAAQPVEVRASA